MPVEYEFISVCPAFFHPGKKVKTRRMHVLCPRQGSLYPVANRKDKTMKPRISVITIGVNDLERSLEFYRDGLGFSTEGIVGKEFENGQVVFFDMENGLRLALYARKGLAWDAGIQQDPPGRTELSLGHNVNSSAEVDEVMEQAKKAGAGIVKPAQKTFWGGYAGYFQDPDGHLWEIAWNPEMKIKE